MPPARWWMSFLGLAYHREYGLPVTIFRLFNTVGPRQTGRYGMVVPRFVAQALRDEPITIFGDGQQSRCFCDVSDVVRALVSLGSEDAAIGKVYNIGSEEEITIGELARRIRSLTSSSSEIVFVPYADAYATGFEDMRRRVPDTTRNQELLGWRPRVSLDDLLMRMRDYMRTHERRLHETAG